MLDHWLPPVLWVGLIFLASSRHFSSVSTSTVFLLAGSKLFPQTCPRRLSQLHIVTRKLFHWIGYFILTLLIARAARYQFPESSESAQLGWTFIAMFLLASADEFHQSRVPNRHGSVSDVMLDVFGGLCAVLFLWHQR